MDNIKTYANNLLQFFHERNKLQQKPQIIFQDDQENSLKTLGKTGQYDPGSQTITISSMSL